MNNDETRRYPIGRFAARDNYSPQDIREGIERIRALPPAIAEVVNDFSAQQWDTPYRDGGWTARQVLHHLADSHLNAYIRFKWTLTEDTPTIKAYDEKLWALTPETRLDAAISLTLLTALHPKWTALLEALHADDLRRQYIHPETGKHVPLDRMIALYAWHGEHHLGHLRLVGTE